MDIILQCRKDIFTGNNNDTVFHIFTRSFKPLFSIINTLSHTLILQSLQSHFFCSLILHNWHQVKEFTQSETRTKSVVTFCVERCEDPKE